MVTAQNNSNLEEEPRSDFSIEIKYVKGSENPSRVFRAMTGIIETCQSLDNHLVKVVDNNIEPVLLLENIETSSIKAWFANTIKHIPDDSLFHLDWKPLIGQYLVRAKYVVIDFLQGKTTIANVRELKPMIDRIFQLAEETEVRRLPAYTPPQAKDLLEDIKGISESLSVLNPNDSAKYIIEQQEVNFNLEFRLAPEAIEDLLSKETISTEGEMILKVKKPDYLGESMWDFRFGDKTISASVQDTDWLEKFQSRKIIVRPGDSIRGIVKTSHRYDYNGELIGTHYILTKIIEVMLASDNEQLGLFGDDSNLT